MSIKIPKPEYNIGDRVKLDLEQKLYNGYTLRSKLIRIIIKNMYKRYKVKKLTPIYKSLVRKNIEVIDLSSGCVITGLSAKAGLCIEFIPCNKCYVDGSYQGMSHFVYDVVVFARINTGDDTRKDMNDVQYCINGKLLSSDFKK